MTKTSAEPILAARGLSPIDQRRHLAQCVGNTPLLELRRIAAEVAQVRIFG